MVCCYAYLLQNIYLFSFRHTFSVSVVEIGILSLLGDGFDGAIFCVAVNHILRGIAEFHRFILRIYSMKFMPIRWEIVGLIGIAQTHPLYSYIWKFYDYLGLRGKW